MQSEGRSRYHTLQCCEADAAEIILSTRTVKGYLEIGYTWTKQGPGIETNSNFRSATLQ